MDLGRVSGQIREVFGEAWRVLPPGPGLALHVADRVAVTFHGLTLLAIRLLGSALDAYARREHLYSPQRNGDEARGPDESPCPW